jgi:hypothetical protein
LLRCSRPTRAQKRLCARFSTRHPAEKNTAQLRTLATPPPRAAAAAHTAVAVAGKGHTALAPAVTPSGRSSTALAPPGVPRRVLTVIVDAAGTLSNGASRRTSVMRDASKTQRAGRASAASPSLSAAGALPGSACPASGEPRSAFQQRAVGSSRAALPAFDDKYMRKTRLREYALRSTNGTGSSWPARRTKQATARASAPRRDTTYSAQNTRTKAPAATAEAKAAPPGACSTR